MEYLPFGETLVDEHLNSYNSPFKFNAKELDPETGNYYYGARYYDPKSSLWLSVDPLAEKYPNFSPYAYTFQNPINFIDPWGMEGEDPVNGNDEKQDIANPKNPIPLQEVEIPGKKAKSRSDLNLNLIASDYPGVVSNPSSLADFKVETLAQIEWYKGKSQNFQKWWFQDYITTGRDEFADKYVLPVLLMCFPQAEAAEIIGSLVAKGAARVFARTAVEEIPLIIEEVTVHGNSLKSLKPTWGYKLYSTDGTFLKNGITSAVKAESRYTKTFMSDKVMLEKTLFPNRAAAYQWEFQQNQILRGPLNFNMH